MGSKLAIMYSGGLDSLISYNYAIKEKGYKKEDITCIWANMGQDYAMKEFDVVAKMDIQFPEYAPEVIQIDMMDLVPALESRLSNQIIPSRNVLLATIGSMFGETVWINALDGEQNGKEHDKSPKFFHDVSKLLTFTNEFFQKKTTVETPFSHMSKADTITWALKAGIPVDVLFETSTCYDKEEQKCGQCLTCYKRYVAFKLNNIDEPGYTVNPLDCDYAKELDKQMPKAILNRDFSRFTEKRCAEWSKLQKKLIG